MSEKRTRIDQMADSGRYMIMNRVWAMPNADTFDCLPIGSFVRKYLGKSKVSIDPFARNERWATYTNDLNPNTQAEYHLDAIEFLRLLEQKNVRADLLIFDPPYSLYQMKESYESVGLKMAAEKFRGRWKHEKDLANKLLISNSIALTFGWDSQGMGKNRGFEIEEILLVCHGANHNDTICVAERKTQGSLFDGIAKTE